jgi:hypothetical protein
MSRIFIKVSDRTRQPILGGFVIVKDHMPRGNYAEVVYKTSSPVQMSIVGNPATATTLVVNFKNGSDKIVNISGYNKSSTMAQLATLLNTDAPGLGSFEASGSSITISSPISSSLVGILTYS